MSKKKKKTDTNLKAQVLKLPGLKFLDEVDSELRKVTWPTREQTLRLTLVVIIVSAFFGVYLGLLDLMFTRLMGLLLELSV